MSSIFKDHRTIGLCVAFLLCFQLIGTGALAQRLQGNSQGVTVTLPSLGQVRVSGTTVYDPEAALLYAAGYIREHHGLYTVPAIAAAIQYLYREHGYFLAEALISTDPDTGRPHILIDEGVISGIEVFGAEGEIGRKVSAYFQHLIDGHPITKPEFERALMLASDLSGVVLSSEIRHDGAGKRIVTLHVNIVRHRVMAIADYGPRQNAASATLMGEAYSQVMPGDMIRLNIGGSRHFDANNNGLNVAVAYRFPIGNDGTYGEILAANTRYGRDLSGNLSDSRFQDGKNFIALVGHPFRRNIHEFFYGLVEYDYADLDSGPAGTSSDSSQAIRLSIYYSSVGNSFGTFRGGLSVTGGVADTQATGRVDDQFWHLRAGAGLVIHLDPPNGDYSLRIEGMGQVTGAALPATEKFYLGDRNRMRGYNIATTLGDSGFAGTVEVSRYIAIEQEFFKAISPAIFFDVGIAQSNTAYPTQYSSKTLASTGIAARLFLRDNFTLSGWLALPLVEDGRDSYMNPAAYIRLTKVW